MNRKKAIALVGRLHERAAQQRKNALHTYSAALVAAHPVLVLETLATKNLMGNRHLARSIGDEGWGELGRQLAYKAAWAGGQVLLAPRFFPSSVTPVEGGCQAASRKRRHRCHSLKQTPASHVWRRNWTPRTGAAYPSGDLLGQRSRMGGAG